MSDVFDLIAIGGGTAGLVTAAGGSGLGARVALIERHRMGGECLWNGCVPSKALIAAGGAAHAVRRAAAFGISATIDRVDMALVRDHIRGVQAQIAPHDSPERFRGLGVTVELGEAALVAPGTVEVNGKRLRARNIVLATGTSPAVPPIPGLSDIPILTNETVFELTEVPRQLLVVGGGPIGTELAQAFCRLGSRVTILEALPGFFAREDPELAALLRSSLESEGIDIRTGSTVVRARTEGADRILRVRDASGVETDLRGDAVLVAVGRRPNVQGLGLEALGIQVDNGGIVTDRFLRTNVRGVFAAGDVVSGGLKFTHVADHMARGVLRNALFPGKSAIDYSAVPWVTYTAPELARVGLTVEQAREQYGSGIGVWRRDLSQVDRMIAEAASPGLVKIVTNRKGTVIGGHILAPGAGEMIGELTMAVKLGLTVAQLGSVIHPYPTVAESIRHAAEQRLKSTFVGWRKTLVQRLVRR